MASVNGMRFIVPNSSQARTMISMLVAPNHMEHIVYRNESIDFGATCLAIMNAMTGDESAVALGVYDLSFEKEILLALNERLPLRRSPLQHFDFRPY